MINAGTIKNSADMANLLQGFVLKEPFIVLPNWHCTTEGYGTDPLTLSYLLAALPGKAVVVEAYDAARTDDSQRFESLDMDAARQHWDYLRQQDQVFLESTGNDKVLAEHGAEYVNVTEEIWAGRIADTGEVASLVEKRYGPIVHTELYGMVPQRLWESRHGTLINCAKIKACYFAGGLFFSLAMKNLFGLIPLPNRMAYHGAHEQGLSRSIVDADQLYHAMFKVISIAEAIHATLIIPQGAFEDPGALVKNLGFAAASDHVVDLDAFIVQAFGSSPEDRHFLKLGAAILGGWDQKNFPPVPVSVAARLREIMGR